MGWLQKCRRAVKELNGKEKKGKGEGLPPPLAHNKNDGFRLGDGTCPNAHPFPLLAISTFSVEMRRKCMELQKDGWGFGDGTFGIIILIGHTYVVFLIDPDESIGWGV
jgi:hypothetical protein